MPHLGLKGDGQNTAKITLPGLTLCYSRLAEAPECELQSLNMMESQDYTLVSVNSSQDYTSSSDESQQTV